MSISPLTSYGLQSSQSSALQALLARMQSTHSDQTASTTSGDQVSVSYFAQYLSKAPKDIAASLQDLVTTRKDVTADLQTLKTYYTANPKELTKLNAAMELQSSHSVQFASMTPAMQAGVMDLYALSGDVDGSSSTAPTKAELGKAILSALQEDSSEAQSSLLDLLNGSDQGSSAASSDSYSLFSYLS